MRLTLLNRNWVASLFPYLQVFFGFGVAIVSIYFLSLTQTINNSIYVTDYSYVFIFNMMIAISYLPIMKNIFFRVVKDKESKVYDLYKFNGMSTTVYASSILIEFLPFITYACVTIPM